MSARTDELTRDEQTQTEGTVQDVSKGSITGGGLGGTCPEI
jgi:hypothetical protein